MDRLPKKRNREVSIQTRDTCQDPTTAAASQLIQHIQHGEAGQIQPLNVTGNGSKTWGNYFASVRATFKCEDGKLPQISTLLSKLPLHRGVSAEVSEDRIRSVASGSTGSGSSEAERPSSGELTLDVPLQTTKSLNTSQVNADGEALNPQPMHLDTASPRGGEGNSPFTSLAIPLLTEEDLRQMQSGQDKNGYIKRPMNAFLVFSYIHRVVLRKASPGATMTDTSVKLGSEWSKLSQEQKRPYYEVAHKLKCLHTQQFPDYEFRPKRKKNRQYLSSEQGAGQDSGIHFVSQTMPPAQSKLLGPIMYACPVNIPYTVGYYPYPCACQYHPMGLYSRFKIHSSGQAAVSCGQARQFLYRYANVSSSSMEGVKKYHNAHLQRNETAPAALAREHYLADVSPEVLAGSTATSESLEQPAASQQPLINNKVECRYEDDVDVVGLLDL